MTDHILTTKKLSKEFKGFTAVSGVNLQIERGHIHALIGPNGAGKTTVFNLLTKFLTPTSGSIHFNGTDNQGRLSPCIKHGDFHHDGGRAAGKTGRFVRARAMRGRV